MKRHIIKMSSLKNNFKYALFAQLITLCTSCIMSFFLPKFISLVDYSYWQLFVFYNMLIVFLNLGYSEGIYLKHAGINKNKIFNLNLSHHFSNICYLQCLFSIVIVCYALLIEDQDKKRQQAVSGNGLACRLFWQNYFIQNPVLPDSDLIPSHL